MRRFLLAVTAALLLFAATASVALMASVTHVIGGGVNGLVFCTYTFDDTTRLITGLGVTNNDTASHLVTGSALDPLTFTVIAAGSVTALPMSQQTWDIRVLGLLMVDHVSGKDGTHYLAPPAIMSCATS